MSGSTNSSLFHYVKVFFAPLLLLTGAIPASVLHFFKKRPSYMAPKDEYKKSRFFNSYYKDFMDFFFPHFNFSKNESNFFAKSWMKFWKRAFKALVISFEILTSLIFHVLSLPVTLMILSAVTVFSTLASLVSSIAKFVSDNISNPAKKLSLSEYFVGNFLAYFSYSLIKIPAILHDLSPLLSSLYFESFYKAARGLTLVASTFAYVGKFSLFSLSEFLKKFPEVYNSFSKVFPSVAKMKKPTFFVPGLARSFYERAEIFNKHIIEKFKKKNSFEHFLNAMGSAFSKSFSLLSSLNKAPSSEETITALESSLQCSIEYLGRIDSHQSQNSGQNLNDTFLENFCELPTVEIQTQENLEQPSESPSDNSEGFSVISVINFFYKGLKKTREILNPSMNVSRQAQTQDKLLAHVQKHNEHLKKVIEKLNTQNQNSSENADKNMLISNDLYLISQDQQSESDSLNILDDEYAVGWRTPTDLTRKFNPKFYHKLIQQHGLLINSIEHQGATSKTKLTLENITLHPITLSSTLNPNHELNQTITLNPGQSITVWHKPVLTEGELMTASAASINSYQEILDTLKETDFIPHFLEFLADSGLHSEIINLIGLIDDQKIENLHSFDSSPYTGSVDQKKEAFAKSLESLLQTDSGKHYVQSAFSNLNLNNLVMGNTNSLSQYDTNKKKIVHREVPVNKVQTVLSLIFKPLNPEMLEKLGTDFKKTEPYPQETKEAFAKTILGFMVIYDLQDFLNVNPHKIDTPHQKSVNAYDSLMQIMDFVQFLALERPGSPNQDEGTSPFASLSSTLEFVTNPEVNVPESINGVHHVLSNLADFWEFKKSSADFWEFKKSSIESQDKTSEEIKVLLDTEEQKLKNFIQEILTMTLNALPYIENAELIEDFHILPDKISKDDPAFSALLDLTKTLGESKGQQNGFDLPLLYNKLNNLLSSGSSPEIEGVLSQYQSSNLQTLITDSLIPTLLKTTSNRKIPLDAESLLFDLLQDNIDASQTGLSSSNYKNSSQAFKDIFNNCFYVLAESHNKHKTPEQLKSDVLTLLFRDKNFIKDILSKLELSAKISNLKKEIDKLKEEKFNSLNQYQQIKRSIDEKTIERKNLMGQQESIIVTLFNTGNTLQSLASSDEYKQDMETFQKFMKLFISESLKNEHTNHLINSLISSNFDLSGYLTLNAVNSLLGINNNYNIENLPIAYTNGWWSFSKAFGSIAGNLVLEASGFTYVAEQTTTYGYGIKATARNLYDYATSCSHYAMRAAAQSVNQHVSVPESLRAALPSSQSFMGY